ncbi:MAG: hypothetical protein GX429_01730 [Bacteroidales bacterium]|nr:hypothetical protein [Bacteroidales bacterium]
MVIISKDEAERLDRLVAQFGQRTVMEALEEKMMGNWSVTYFPDVDSWEVSDYGDHSYIIKDGEKCNCGKGYGKSGSCIHQVLVELKKWDLEEELNETG